MSSPLFDVSLSFEERIDWLLKNMTLEEKLQSMASRLVGTERLGFATFGLGGEAAHGIQARNDHLNPPSPDITTSFPQPIGMSASWDRELIRKCGEVVGIEARVVGSKKGWRGLSRWAPTVDLERDPRWGRNEESYGEDPVLTGMMAASYVRGMQGEDEKYIRCASTLKHFYANNTEVGRAWKNASIDPRNKYELYLEPFRRCIEEGKAQGVMTAYNRINGQVGILNDDVKKILKGQYGLTHAVGDGGALNLVVTNQHTFGTHAEAIAAALKAGVDGMSDQVPMVDQAARDAYAQGLITEEDLDNALRCKAMVAMRAGHFDGDECPYAHYTDEDLCSKEADAVALDMAEKSLVLMKNEGLLPFEKSERAALIGPMADTWYMDWYGGVPPCKKTVKDGLSALSVAHSHADGWDRVMIKMKGRGLCVKEDGSVALSDTPDVFAMEDWGENSFTFRCIRTSKYLSITMNEPSSTLHNALCAERAEPFDWFALEIFRFEDTEKGRILLNRFHWPVEEKEGKLVSGQGCEGTPVEIELVESGINRAAELAKEADHVILALGNTPLIPAKEEFDRETLFLPAHQQKLMEAIFAANPRCALVLVANYPYAIPFAKENIPAILLSASGGQHMGDAIANALYGDISPAGRLNMTWYCHENQLPDIDDYDIIRGKRTYRYFDGDVLYPFGFGLTYTRFAYSNFSVELKEDTLHFAFDVENIGSRTSDEVVQVYAVAPPSRVQKALRQLVAFDRLHDVQPGEKRTVTLTAPVQELRFYDVTRQKLMVEEGEYRFFAGPSSQEEAVGGTLFVPGEHTQLRDMRTLTPADHYDECEDVSILQGTLGYTAICPRTGAEKATVLYRDCHFDAECGYLSLRLKSVKGGSVKVLWNDREIGSFQGDTALTDHRSSPPLDRFAHIERAARALERQPIWDEIDIPLPENAQDGTLQLVLSGDVLLSFMTTKKAPAERKIQLGAAN